MEGYERFSSVKSTPSQAAKRLSKHVIGKSNQQAVTVYVRRKKKHHNSFYADKRTPRVYAFNVTKTQEPVTENMVRLAKEREYKKEWKMGDTYEKMNVKSLMWKKEDILNVLKHEAREAVNNVTSSDEH